MRTRWLLIGLLAAALAGCEAGHARHEEIKVPLAQVPAAVQATLTKESGGATITEVEKEVKEGKTCYEADVILNSKNYEIKVAEDGTLLVKKLEKHEGKEEKGQHEDEHEDKK